MTPVRVPAGSKRHRLQVQTYTVTRAPSGQEIKTWSTAATVWAAVEPLTGSEFFSAQTTFGETTTRFLMDYREELVVAAPMRLVDSGGGIWDVKSVVDRSFVHTTLEVLAVKRG